MSCPPKLSRLQRSAIKLLAMLFGYKNNRITELVLPLLDVEGLTRSNLEKIIDRIRDDNGISQWPAVPPGTYLVHQVGVNYSQKSEHILIILEMHTGWVQATIMEKIRPADIVSKLYKMHNDIGSVCKTEKSVPKRPFKKSVAKYRPAKLPFNQIILLSYNKQKKKVVADNSVPAAEQGAVTANKIEEMEELATVIRISAEKLAGELKQKLEPYDKNTTTITKRMLPEEPKDRIVLGDNYSRKALNEKMREILNQYTHTDREQIKYPRTKETVTPVLRLYEALMDIHQKNPHHKQAKPAKPEIYMIDDKLIEFYIKRTK